MLFASCFYLSDFRNPNSVFDGVPEVSISVPPERNFPYLFVPRDEGTYMYHCHVEATEHMEMGMLANLHVRPAQNRLPDQTPLGAHTHSNPDYDPCLEEWVQGGIS